MSEFELNDPEAVPGQEKQEIDYDQIAYGATINRIQQGQEFDITEMDPALNNVHLGLGWDLKSFEENPLDLDSSLFLLNKDDKTRENEDFVFYNNPRNLEGSVIHKGDSRTGAGEGDDETIILTLKEISFEILRIAFIVSIYDPEFKGHNFSDVKNVFFRFVNNDNKNELFRFELDETMMGKSTALMIGFMERIGPKWIFRAVGEPIEGGLAQAARDYGIVVAEDVQA